MEETWKIIETVGGNYQISNRGRLKNRRGRLNTPYRNKDGYMVFKFSVDGVKIRKFIHRLVALAFLPNPENKPEIHHKDHNKENNNVENLMWVTTYENNALNFDNPNCLQTKREDFVTPEWCQMISDSLPKGKNHHKFTGYYLVGDKFYESSLAAEKATGIHHNVIQSRCKVTKPPGYDFIPVTKSV